MVFPRNFDKPDEVFAIAKAWAEHREEKSPGVKAIGEYKFVVSATWLDGEPARSANDARRRFRLVLSEGLPSKPGIYCFYTPFEFYVGETQDLKKRVDQYANAGMVERPLKEYTNRSVQRKIYETLKRGEQVMLRYCTSAQIRCDDGSFIVLDFEKKYHRILVEGLTVSTQPSSLISWNKQK